MSKLPIFLPAEVPQELLADRRISISAKGVYAFLQIFATETHIDFVEACEKYNVHFDVFKESLDQLIAHEYISVENELGVNFYVLNGI